MSNVGKQEQPHIIRFAEDNHKADASTASDDQSPKEQEDGE